jgi:hypothetical protein
MPRACASASSASSCSDLPGTARRVTTTCRQEASRQRTRTGTVASRRLGWGVGQGRHFYAVVCMCMCWGLEAGGRSTPSISSAAQLTPLFVWVLQDDDTSTEHQGRRWQRRTQADTLGPPASGAAAAFCVRGHLCRSRVHSSNAAAGHIIFLPGSLLNESTPYT